MLTVTPLEKARALLLAESARLAELKTPSPASPECWESLSLPGATGRILAESILAPAPVPSFDRSQVDGLAVRAVDTFGASEALPAILNFAGEGWMGQPATRPLQPGECFAVATGGMLPAGADAMVMIEDVEQLDQETRLVTRSVSPGNQVTRCGDDCQAGQLILEAGRRLRAPEIGAIAALGLDRVRVRPLVRVAIVSTGDELIAAGSVAQVNAAPAGLIFDANGPMLAAAVQEAGGLPVPLGIVRDQLGELTTVLEQALGQADLVLVSGGSSVGARDYVEQAIAAAGTPGVVLHGLAVKPGKPTLAGICQGKIVIGLPGHPVAAWFIFEQLVRPLIQQQSGLDPERFIPCTVMARTSSRIPSNHGREEFVLVRLVRPGADLRPMDGEPDEAWPGHEIWLAEPLPTRSGLITQLSTSDGYLRIDRDSEGLEAGVLVRVTLLRSEMPWRKPI